MVKLRYIGKYQPVGMIIDVKEEEVQGILNDGNYETLGKKIIPETVNVPKKEVVDDNSKRVKTRLQSNIKIR